MQLGADAAGFFRLIELPLVDSTSSEVRRLSALGADEGTLVWAHAQTAGRGRLGRSWLSPPGNLYFSLLLRPGGSASAASQLTFVASIAMAETIAGLVPRNKTTCKWPNDVLIDGGKVAGILLESQVDGGGEISSLVVGIGVNVASHPPAETVMYRATSLGAHGAEEATPQSVLDAFCPIFLRWYRLWHQQGFPPVQSAWLGRAEKLHDTVEVRLANGSVSGTFAGLDASGALVLQSADRRRLILAGDVFPAA